MSQWIVLFLVLPVLISCSEFSQTSLQENTEGSFTEPPPETEPPSTEPEEDISVPDDRSFCQSKDIQESWPVANKNPMYNTDLNGLSGARRDRLVLQEWDNGASGPLRVSEVVARADNTEIIFCVSNDYLALLDADTPLRFPLGMAAVQELTAESDWTLPTRKMVDLIYQQSEIKLTPRPIPPSNQMESTPVVLDHSDMVNEQLSGRTGLIAGHKKDVVISNRLVSRPNRIAIYGWHRSNGQPIQPLSTVHHKDYGDYSQGVRLIYKQVLVNGEQQSLGSVLRNSSLAPLLSDEGVLNSNLVNTYY